MCIGFPDEEPRNARHIIGASVMLRKKPGRVPGFFHLDPAALGGVVGVSEGGFYGTVLRIQGDFESPWKAKRQI